MREIILNFQKQFSLRPELQNDSGISADSPKATVVGGMGGSALAGLILQNIKSELPLFVHRSYGVPCGIPVSPQETQYIAVSHSGNTEETLDFAHEALRQGGQVGVITQGGRLLAWAIENKIPHIVLPNDAIQPRLALGYHMVALLKFMPGTISLNDTEEITSALAPSTFEAAGTELGNMLKGKIPVVYASERNSSLAYIWKIKFNETAKIPAFWNIFPELNHNEMAGSDTRDTAVKKLLHFVFLTDAEDSERVKLRMSITSELYRKEGFSASIHALQGKARVTRMFGSILTADWATLRLSEINHTEPDAVKIIEEFKKKLA